MTALKASNKYKQVQLQLLKEQLQVWTHRSTHSFLVIHFGGPFLGSFLCVDNAVVAFTNIYIVKSNFRMQFQFPK